MAYNTFVSKDNSLSNTGFKRSLLSLCVMAAVTNAYSQEAEEAESIEEVVVYGVKRSIESAQDIKREADTVVDAISASDINSLPDKSVLEAVQRLPGVSIERFAASNDADHFSVEGSGVVIRGLTQTRSEFNGRDSFSASDGNGLSFQDVPPELMGSVQLLKNQSADMIEGGISGTINLITRKPLDSGARLLAFSAKANYADHIDKTTPSISGLWSDRWETDAGEFGVLVNVSNSNLKSRADGIQIYNYFERSVENGNAINGENSTVWVPQGANIRRQEFDRDREGAALALQWRNPAETILTTFEVIHSDSTVAWNERALDYPDQPIAPRDVQPLSGTDFTYADNNGLSYFQSGIISDPFDNQGGERYLTYTRDQRSESTIDDISLTIEFRASDRLTFSGDLQYIDAAYSQADITAHGSIFTDVALDLSGSLPRLSYLGDATAASAESDLTPLTGTATTYLRSAMDHLEEDDGESIAARFDAEFEIEQGWVKSIQSGVRFSDKKQTVRESTYNWGMVSESWGAGGEIASFFDRVESIDPDMVEEYTFDDFHRGSGLRGADTFVFPALDLVDVDNYDRYNSRIAPFNNGGDWTALAQRQGVAEGTPFLPTEISATEQESRAAYIRLNFGSEDYGKRFSGNIGLRYISYDWDLAGGVTFPDDGNSNLNRFFSADDVAFSTFGLEPNMTADSYETVLPSFNLKVEVTDDLISRFAYSKAISLPDVRDKRNHLTVSRQTLQTFNPNDPTEVIDSEIVGYTGTGGNPNLNPMVSNQYDLSLEWYFASAGSLTGTLFYKEVNDFYRFGASGIDVTNNGVTRTVVVNGPINGGDGFIKGFELAYSQFYDRLPAPFDGFGIQANYTYIEENGSPGAALTPEGEEISNAFGVFEGLPLEGLSKDTFNFIAMYEKEGISARLAYNYRSGYLLTTRDVITFAPNLHDSTEQLDASIFYSINDSIKIGIEANNLTDEVNKLIQVTDEDLNEAARSYFINDRRYALVLRATF